jgi:hypothetical protein
MHRLKRWSKRVGILVLVLFVTLTLASLAYNAATDGRVKPATALYRGPFVQIGARLVAYRSWGRSGSPILLLGDGKGPTPSVADDTSVTLASRRRDRRG